VHIKNDIINLLNPENESEPKHVDVLDRFAISHGVAASGLFLEDLSNLIYF
jgi:hypothetical protein